MGAIPGLRDWVRAAVLLGMLGAGGCREQPGGATTAATVAAPSAPARAATTAADLRRVMVFISGHVQGVGFRAFTEQEARRLEVGGWVRNLADGRVQAVIEGPGGKVARLLELLGKGPPGARVDQVEVSEQAVKGDLGTFRVAE
jgi:acylphosphatase